MKAYRTYSGSWTATCFSTKIGMGRGRGSGSNFGLRSLAISAPFTSFRMILFFFPASAPDMNSDVASSNDNIMAKIFMVVTGVDGI